MISATSLPIDQLHPSEDNPRRNVGDVTELATSIRTVGILEPLVVSPNAQGYVIVAGARRFAAAKVAGLTEVPVVVREFTEIERQEAMLIENLQRADLAPLEEGAAFARLLELSPDMTQAQLGDRLGRSQAHISKRLALLELPPAARKALDSGGITLSEATELTKLAAEPKRIATVLKESNRDIARGVKAELEAVEYSKKLVTATELAKADPAPFVEPVRNKWNRGELEVPAGAARLSRDFGGVGLSPAKHRKLECHAVTVTASYWHKPALTYICTKPSNHRADAARNEPSAADRRRKDHEKALRAAAAVRQEFVAGVLKERIPREESVDAIVRSLVDAAWQDVRIRALSLLGLEPKTTTRSGHTERDATSPLLELVDAGAAGALRVGMALTLASGEESVRHSWGFGDKSKAYFEFLKARGYQPSKAEQLQLSGEGASLTTFSDDFVRIRLAQGMVVNFTLEQLELEWPPPLRIAVRTSEVLGFDTLVAFDMDKHPIGPDDVVYHRVSYSQIDDEDREDMIGIARGALYAHAIASEQRA